MTESGEGATREGHGRQGSVVAPLVWAALLLAPLLVGLFVAATDAAHHPDPVNWQYNHARKVALENAGRLLVGAPVVGALLGAGLAAVWGWCTQRSITLTVLMERRSRPGLYAARGTLLGTVGLYVYAGVQFYVGLQHVYIPW